MNWVSRHTESLSLHLYPNDHDLDKLLSNWIPYCKARLRDCHDETSPHASKQNVFSNFSQNGVNRKAFCSEILLLSSGIVNRQNLESLISHVLQLLQNCCINFYCIIVWKIVSMVLHPHSTIYRQLQVHSAMLYVWLFSNYCMLR